MYSVPLPWLIAASAAVGIGFVVYNNWDTIVDSRTWEENWALLESKLGVKSGATETKSNLYDSYDTELDTIGSSSSDTETGTKPGVTQRKKKAKARSTALEQYQSGDIRQRNAFDMPSSADSKVNMEILASESEQSEFYSEFSLLSEPELSDFSVGDADIE